MHEAIQEVVPTEAEWRLWVGVASAAATTAAVAVALFGEPLRRYWSRPRLRMLAFDMGAADGVEMVSPDKAVEEAWIRLRIQNIGKRTARMVEVTIDNLVPIGHGAEDGRREEEFRRQQPSAAVGRQLKWADRSTATIDIPAGTSRRVDIFHVSTDEPRFTTEAFEIAVPMRLTLHPPSKVEREVLPGQKYRLVLSIVGVNVRPSRYEVEIWFGGVWRKGHEIWETERGGMAISQPREIGFDGP
jgi:hypothetical protein